MGRAKKISVLIGIMGLWILPGGKIELSLAKDANYPTKSINFYIPYGAGGTTDISCRALIEASGKHLGQSFIPVNKPGGAGTISAMAVMNARPDGYTLGAVANSETFVAPFAELCPYKDLSGFTLIMNYGRYVFTVLVRGDAPWKSWKEFIDWSKKNPRAAKIGIMGAKTSSYAGFLLWQVEKNEQAQFTYIPLKSSAEVLTATLGGHINMFASTVDGSTMPYIKEGKLRVLAYFGVEKLPGYEKFPSLQEMYGILVPNILGVWGPKGLPEQVLDTLKDAFAKAVRDPEFVGVMDRMYTPVVYMDRNEFSKYVNDLYPKIYEKYKFLKNEGAKEKK